MPLPGSPRDKKQKEMLQEIVEPTVEPTPQPEFLQEINEPTHEEPLVEEQKPKRRSRKKKFGLI